MSLSGPYGVDEAQVSGNYTPDESRISDKQQQIDFLDSLMISQDKDSNGILTLDESGLSKEDFSKLDPDGNDMVTPAEMQAVLQKLHKEKGELGKLDVEMQQAAESSSQSSNAASQTMVGFDDSGLDADTLNILNSDEEDKVSQADSDLIKDAEAQEQGEGSPFSEALSEFKKNFFQKEKDEEEKDLNKDGVVSKEEEEQAEQQAAQVTGVNTEESKKTATKIKPQGRSFSARQLAGARAYQNQASEFFAAASKSSVSFQY